MPFYYCQALKSLIQHLQPVSYDNLPICRLDPIINGIQKVHIIQFQPTKWAPFIINSFLFGSLVHIPGAEKEVPSGNIIGGNRFISWELQCIYLRTGHWSIFWRRTVWAPYPDQPSSISTLLPQLLTEVNYFCPIFPHFLNTSAKATGQDRRCHFVLKKKNCCVWYSLSSFVECNWSSLASTSVNGTKEARPSASVQRTVGLYYKMQFDPLFKLKKSQM